MDISSIVSAIANMGFPAVMCILIFWRMDKQDENYKSVMQTMEKTIQENTIAITRLADKL